MGCCPTRVRPRKGHHDPAQTAASGRASGRGRGAVPCSALLVWEDVEPDRRCQEQGQQRFPEWYHNSQAEALRSRASAP